MMRAVTGSPSNVSQKGLSAVRVEQNYFLPCTCVPDKDLEVIYPNNDAIQVATEVHGVSLFNSNIAKLRLRLPKQFDYRAGQYIRIYNQNNVGRCYSLASVPSLDDFLEVHVKRILHGAVSSWIFKSLTCGDTIKISEPIGRCIYLANEPTQPMLLIGTGTGLGPLYGILRDALHNNHIGPITLFHGSSRLGGLYLRQNLMSLSKNHSFNYIPCLSRGDAVEGVSLGRASDLALSRYSDLGGWRGYISGNPSMVEETKKAVFLAGASLGDIYSDAFTRS
jgi:NAD(P)H-flavin reductase